MIPLEPWHDDPRTPEDIAAEREVVARAVHGLTPDQLALVVGHHVLGETLDDLGRRCGLSREGIRERIRKALARCRKDAAKTIVLVNDSVALEAYELAFERARLRCAEVDEDRERRRARAAARAALNRDLEIARARSQAEAAAALAQLRREEARRSEARLRVEREREERRAADLLAKRARLKELAAAVGALPARERGLARLEIAAIKAELRWEARP